MGYPQWWLNQRHREHLRRPMDPGRSSYGLCGWCDREIQAEDDKVWVAALDFRGYVHRVRCHERLDTPKISRKST